MAGFTLVEMVLVIVLLGILSGVLAPVITQMMHGYRDTAGYADLTDKGRLALEKLAREVRHAVPNTLAVVTDASGNPGIRFVRSRNGGRFDDCDDPVDATNCFTPGASLNQLLVYDSGLSVNGNNEILVIGNTGYADLEGGGSWSLLTGDQAHADGQLLQFNANTFTHDSPGNRFQIADTLVEVGLNGDSLRWHTQGLSNTGPLNPYDSVDGRWGNGDPLLIDGIQQLSFDYVPGEPFANAVLQISMTLSQGGDEVDLYEEVHIRNVP